MNLILTEKHFYAGILIGFGFLFKIHFFVLLPLLFVFKNYKVVISSLLTFGIGILIPLLFLGQNSYLSILEAWFFSMKEHNISIYNSPDTIYAWINKILSLIHLEQQNFYFSIILLLILFSVFILIIKKQKIIAINYDNKVFTIIYFIYIAIIPNITVTDSEHFIFTLPLIIYGVIMVLYSKKITFYIKLFLCIGFFIYGANWHDLLGHRLSVLYTESGMLGLGNMIIIGVIFYFWSFKKIEIV